MVHKCLDAFSLRVPVRPAPTTDLTTIQTELACLRPDVDAILEIRGTDPESAPNDLTGARGLVQGPH